MICEAHDLLLEQVQGLAAEVHGIRTMIIKSAIATISALTAVITVLGGLI